MHDDKDLLQPTPHRAADDLAVDAVQLWRVHEAVFLQQMLDSARPASSPTIEGHIDLKHAVLILPFEDDERVGYHLTAAR